MKHIGYFISFLIVYLFYFPFKVLPYKWCLAYGIFLTKLIYPLDKKHRKVAADNIRFAFPAYSEDQILNLVKAHYRHLGILLAHTLWAPRMTRKWLDENLVVDAESLNIEEETKKQGVGVILISGHFGTWEILVQFLGIRMKGGGIYKKVRNPFVDQLLRRMRSKNGVVLVPVQESTQVIKLLKQGYWIGFGADQNAGKAGIFVPFMNRQASTFVGPALMAYLTGAKMLYYSVLAGEGGKVIVRVKDLGFVDKKLYPSKDDVIRHYTELWTKTLEEEVKLFPEQYFWVHRRWRTQPQLQETGNN
ncbi:lysophospholipid acyltransferase family protein [Leptospira brenneri]|uniref:Lauroyl acyltransferase n=1 Tax=Leptospira brenneri TaxID=2023182 RepID=A0A2M9Y6B6_9LEPT|nr:lauroyl acyltransferase [Leptospira brenneri]PJZ47111.1 lauroyl acyltransferase [Leptospira brenneri]TGK95929.1 lauroyl acyltransferase [Leptospira brenneri]